MSRYLRVRQWCPLTGELSAPYVADRRHNTLAPAVGSPEWWQSKRTGRWGRVVATGLLAGACLATGQGGLYDPLTWGLPLAGTIIGGIQPIAPYLLFPGPFETAGTSTLSLGTTTTFGGARIVPRKNDTINEVYFYVSSAGSSTDIAVDLRDNTGNKPGSVLTGGAAVQVGSIATGWEKATGFTASVTAGTPYWATVGDDNFSSGAHTIQVGAKIADVGITVRGHATGLVATTTNSWTTTTYNNARHANILVVMASGDVYGSPYISAASPSNSGESRGLRMDGLTEDLDIHGVIGGIATSLWTTGQIFTADNGPSGTAQDESTRLIQQASTTTGYVGWLTAGATYRLAKGISHSLVAKFSSQNTSGPSKISVGTNHDATVRGAMAGGSGWHWRQSAASITTWGGDDTAAQPQIAILVADQVAAGFLAPRRQVAVPVGYTARFGG